MGWWSSKQKFKIKCINGQTYQGHDVHRDVVIHGHNIQKSSTPTDVPDRGHKIQECHDQKTLYIWGHNESRNILI
jgi:hypothetical protein